MLAQEHYVVCWKCEEMMPRGADICPYCDAPRMREPKPTVHVHAAAQSSVAVFLMALGSLLIGSALLTLAVMVLLFSKDGALTISWPERSWISFLGLGMTCAAVGVLCLCSTSQSDD